VRDILIALFGYEWSSVARATDEVAELDFD